MNKTVVTIHQPNFFPWLGYFAKITQADVFVFLDAVDYPKSGSSMSSYTNRVKINQQGAATWWGCPVVREKGRQDIGKVLINKTQDWARKKLMTLEQSYAKAPYFGECIGDIREMVLLDEDLIAEYNMACVKRTCELLGIGSRFVRQSELHTSGASTDLLVEIIQKLDGTCYLSGTGGAKKYQQEDKFEAAGIDLVYNPFKQRDYPQVRTDEFLPGLSVLDAVFQLGWQGAREIITGQGA